MRSALILVPILFLVALIALGLTLYKKTNSDTACMGEECAQLTAEELADRAIEAHQ